MKFFLLKGRVQKMENFKKFVIKLVAVTLDLVIGSQDFVWVAAAG